MGTHVWAGFYENAFRMIQACYAELNRPADWPLATWQDAFKPHSFFITMEEFVDGLDVDVLPTPAFYYGMERGTLSRSNWSLAKRW